MHFGGHCDEMTSAGLPPYFFGSSGTYNLMDFAWIKRKNMQENLNSRIRYLIWLDANALREKMGLAGIDDHTTKL
jgi:hypothetical protein